MRPPGSAKELESRRRRAISLIQAGYSQADVARQVGASESSVHRWLQMARRKGDALAAIPHPGRPRLLSAADDRKLVRLLKKGAASFGWPNNLWTAPRVGSLIQREFGIDYHSDYVRRILVHHLGWTSQKPETKARERDEVEIQRWTDEEMPRIKKLRA